MRRFLLLTVLLVGLAGTGLAETIFGSSGIGWQRSFAGTRYIGMGGAGLALSDSIYLNTENPASFIATGLTRYAMGAYVSKSFANDGTSTDHQDDFGVHGAALGFSLYKTYGLGVHYMPTSDHNFLFIKRGTFHTDTPIQDETDFAYSERFQGEGGLSQLGVTNAFRYGKVAVGVTAQYYFGMLETLSKRRFLSGAILPSGQFQSNELSGFGARIGVTGRFSSRLRVSATVQLPALIKNSTITEFEGGDSLKKKGEDIELPLGVRLGAAYTLGLNRVAVDGGMELWEEASNAWQPSTKYHNSLDVALGYERLAGRTVLAAWYRKLTYRAGVRYSEHYVMVQDEVVGNLRAAVGFGVPVRVGRGMLDFAITADMRGYDAAFNTKETIWGVQFGWSATELWFHRRARR